MKEQMTSRTRLLSVFAVCPPKKLGCSYYIYIKHWFPSTCWLFDVVNDLKLISSGQGCLRSSVSTLNFTWLIQKMGQTLWMNVFVKTTALCWSCADSDGPARARRPAESSSGLWGRHGEVMPRYGCYHGDSSISMAMPWQPSMNSD